MSMSKKDFIALADYIREHNEIEVKAMGVDAKLFTKDHLETLGNFCQSRNSAFLRSRWAEYIAGKCGPNGGVR